MLKRIVPSLGLLLFLGLITWVAVPVTAESELPQAIIYTPTAGPDGRILYFIKPGDSCLSVSLLMGVDINELRLLNNLDDDCLLIEGQELLLGISEEASPTPDLILTDTSLLPTPTPFNGNGVICVFLFEDINGNSMAEESENSIAGGEISITDRQGKISLTGTTTFSDKLLCFEDTPEGEYNISVAPPEGYNPTTSMNYPLELFAGDKSILDFGAQIGSHEIESPLSEEPRSPLLGILGGGMILTGLFLGFYFFRLKR